MASMAEVLEYANYYHNITIMHDLQKCFSRISSIICFYLYICITFFRLAISLFSISPLMLITSPPPEGVVGGL